MALFKDVIVTEAISIRTTPGNIFNYLTSIVDDDSYKALHDANNVSFRWLKGQPWVVGSIAYAEHYLHGELHKFEFIVTKVVPNRHIEYMPTSRLMRRFFSRKEFVIEEDDDTCLFTTSETLRVGWIMRTFFKKHLENGLSSTRRHMREEGENLKRILES
ncbi:MAG: hypothetical protein R6U93_03285 [Dehalococcoidia bacterium]